MKQYAYVGCRTTKERDARGKGIKVYEVDDNGSWQFQHLVDDLVNPSYLCLDETKQYLYTIHGDFSEISAFLIDPETGDLKLLNTVSTEGVNPVHLSVDQSNRWIFVANLQTGTVAVIGRNQDGSLGSCKQLYTIPGLAADTISHPHQVIQDNSRNYLLVSCQGRKQGFGQVVVFKIDSEDGTLTQTCVVRSREIAEPRHIAVHPNNRFVYGVNEKDYSVTLYYFDDQTGQLIPQQILPTLPSDYTGDGWASGIVLDLTGQVVIVSNRKHDSLTSFRIDPVSGKLTYADCIKTDGQQPRYIVMDAINRVIAANEVSDTIRGFAVDTETGALAGTDFVVESESPVCVIYR